MWDQRYNVDEYVYGTAPNVFLREQLGVLTSGMHVLSVADGEGRNGVWLAEKNMQVLSVDASSVAQEKAKRLATQRGVEMAFECADVLDQNWWGSARFDAVVAIFIQFADAAGRGIVFDGIKSALKPGGLLLLQGYTTRQLVFNTGGPSTVDNLYTDEMLCGLLSGWDILHWCEHDSHISEGRFHHGMSALIDVIVRKPVQPEALGACRT